ncbi:MAG: TIGR02530 family flagellar biosynthesis protein [Tuberibacillus sp.]
MTPLDSINPYINYPKVRPTGAAPKPVVQSSFQTALTQAFVSNMPAPLKISKHAAQRMAERQIFIQPSQWQKIYDKVSEAKAMGIKESLVVTKNEALVVSPQNETVITVMNRSEASKQIFSNIDGAILLDS